MYAVDNKLSGGFWYAVADALLNQDTENMWTRLHAIRLVHDAQEYLDQQIADTRSLQSYPGEYRNRPQFRRWTERLREAIRLMIAKLNGDVTYGTFPRMSMSWRA